MTVELATRERCRAAEFLLLTKPRLALLVLLAAFAGHVLGSDGRLDPGRAFHLLLGTALVAGGANAFNMWLERDADARMRRTASRPLPGGRLSSREVVLFAAASSAAGLLDLALVVNPLSAAIAAATLVGYLAVYTPMKRLSALNTVVGAVPGALPPLVGYAGSAGGLDARAFTLFAILFLWQLPHFLSISWLHRADYARGGFVMLSSMDPSGHRTGRQIVVHSLELLVASLLPAFLGQAGGAYLLGASILGAGFVAVGVAVALTRSEAWAKRHFQASIAYLPALLLLLMLDKR